MKNIVLEFENLRRANGFNFAKGAFIDEFRNSSEKHLKYFKQEPSFIVLSLDEQCLFVATIHALYIEFNQNVPSWIKQMKYKLKLPYFGNKPICDKYKEYLLEVTPQCLKEHNVFIGENAMRRI